MILIFDAVHMHGHRLANHKRCAVSCGHINPRVR
ncbi:Uncharacterised protein [Vibrio cholerae]|nr:Uncharacterised protein [Vibrio cholerae]